MKNQKEENEMLYKTLLNMKRETQLQKEKVAWAREQVELMEEHVGMIANNPNYTMEELERRYDSSNTGVPTTMGHPKGALGEDVRLNSVSAPATAN